MAAPRFGGIPTDIDIRALRDAYGVPEIGQRIEYADVEATIKVPQRYPRFRTVTNRWRQQLAREHNVYIAARDGAFVAMSSPERVDHGAAKVRSGVRAMRRAHTVIGATDRSQLTPEQRQRADHLQMVATSVMQAARLNDKRTLPTLPESVKN